MRTETDLRDAMDQIADTARSPEVVLTRMTARRRRSGPRTATFVAVTAAMVAVTAIAVPAVFRSSAGVPPIAGQPSGPAGVGLPWTISHTVQAPDGWRVRIQRLTLTTETTIVDYPAIGPATMSCTITVLRDPAAGSTGTAITCPDEASRALLAKAVTDKSSTITLPYKFNSLPAEYRPVMLAVERVDDETTTTVTLAASATDPELTVTSSSLGFGRTAETGGRRDGYWISEANIDADGHSILVHGQTPLPKSTAAAQRSLQRQVQDVVASIEFSKTMIPADEALTP